MNRRKFFAGLACAPVSAGAAMASAHTQYESAPIVFSFNKSEFDEWIAEAKEELLRDHAAKSIRVIRAVSRGRMTANEARRAMRAL